MRKEQLTLDPKQLIFIDETAATTKMTRLYGRAPQGKRLVDKVPHGHWKTTTFICGLRYDGVTAPFVLDGPMDGLHFLAYVEQILAPTLKKGQIVFLDNVSTHKVDGVEEAIEAGHTRVKVAELYNMALSTVGGFIKRKRETGSVSPDKFGGHKTFAREPHTTLVKELVAEQPDSTLAELQVRLAKEKVKVSQSGISRFLHHINLTFKKKRTRGGTRSARRCRGP